MTLFCIYRRLVAIKPNVFGENLAQFHSAAMAAVHCELRSQWAQHTTTRTATTTNQERAGHRRSAPHEAFRIFPKHAISQGAQCLSYFGKPYYLKTIYIYQKLIIKQSNILQCSNNTYKHVTVIKNKNLTYYNIIHCFKIICQLIIFYEFFKKKKLYLAWILMV